MTPLTPDEFAARMREINDKMGGDPEIAHAAADALLVFVLKQLGYGMGCDLFEDMDLWYA